MAKYSTGGFVCLPGGYGTFEEMMEMITWNQVRLFPLAIIWLISSLESIPYPSWFSTVRPLISQQRDAYEQSETSTPRSGLY
jgi:predicted Rossmann-fold nucleotide-binding protein